MNTKMKLISFLVLAILISSCGGSATPVSVQNPPVIPTVVQNPPQSTATTEQATVVPTAQEMTKLKMTIARRSAYAPFLIAQEEGFLKNSASKWNLLPLIKLRRQSPC